MNLLTNSAHAIGSRHGWIRVATGACLVDEETARGCHGLVVGPWVRLVVEDDGCGIPAAIRERVFEPYFTTKPPGKGTGLGLSLVHGIVRAHGGALSLDSEQDKGTMVRVYLPVGASEEAGASESEEPALPRVMQGRGERVLLVDDEESILDPAKKLLNLLGYQVSAHTRPAEALAEFRADPGAFEILVTDFVMPGLDGFELGAAVRGVRGDLPMILTTGMSQDFSPEQASKQGFGMVVVKPFSAVALAVRVRECLDARGGQPTGGGRTEERLVVQG